MCPRAQSWQVAESGYALSSLTCRRDCGVVLIPRVTLPPDTQGRALSHANQDGHRGGVAGFGDSPGGYTSSAVSLFRGVRHGEFMWKKLPVLHLVGGSEALMAKRLAYLTGLPAHPRGSEPLRAVRSRPAAQKLSTPKQTLFLVGTEKGGLRCPASPHTHLLPPGGAGDGPAERSTPPPC